MEDIEGGMLDAFQSGDFAMSIDGKQIPVIYLTNERWGDFAKSWEFNDGDKNMVPPYILIERGRVQKGTYYEGRYNTPVKNYLYYKKPTFDLIVGEIHLHEGAWVGAKAVVCPGITAFSHAMLTVGSVATSNTESYSVYQGNPAQLKRKRVLRSLS